MDESSVMECGPRAQAAKSTPACSGRNEFVVFENSEIDRTIYCDKSGAEQCRGASRRLIELAHASLEHSIHTHIHIHPPTHTCIHTYTHTWLLFEGNFCTN